MLHFLPSHSLLNPLEPGFHPHPATQSVLSKLTDNLHVAKYNRPLPVLSVFDQHTVDQSFILEAFLSRGTCDAHLCCLPTALTASLQTLSDLPGPLAPGAPHASDFCTFLQSPSW